MKLRILFLLWLLLVACQDREPEVSSGTSPSPATDTPTVPAVDPTEDLEPATSVPNTPTVANGSSAEATASPSSTAELPTGVPPTLTPASSSIELTPTGTEILAGGQPAESIKLVPFIETGLTRPVYLTHASDNRLFVVEQQGTVRIVENGAIVAEPYLDIRDRVGSGGTEQGFLSIAFHPDFDAAGQLGFGRLFAYYTDRNGDVIVSSFDVADEEANQVDATSERILLAVEQPYVNHNGGQLQFGPDGYLYVGLGDGGSGGDPLGHGQNPMTLLGTILRLDVDHPDEGYNYGIPDDNPFLSDSTGRDEIWAYGLRNPWRFSFDGLTGDLYIADVGQNNWEEVHFQAAADGGGQNYGWNVIEGSHCYAQSGCETSGLQMPVFEYSHQQGCSVTGGYVYRGEMFPQLQGNYFVADYCTGIVWALFHAGDGTWTIHEVADVDFTISSFGQDASGELYVLGHNNGRVYHLIP